MDLYEKEEEKKKAVRPEVHQEKQVSEADLLFDKKYTCPVCDSGFYAKTIMAGKVKLLGVDDDLRPRYQVVDTLKYDGIICNKCGYAALSRYFNYINPAQIKLIREKITPYFKPLDDTRPVYSYDDAIARHQLALADAVVKKGKKSEIAYICLKLAWLLRGKAENLEENLAGRNVVASELKEEEEAFLAKAYEGLDTAMYKETYPIAGMDEWTCTYLVAVLAARCNDNTKAMKLLSDIIVSRAASEKMKDRARNIRKQIEDKSK